MPACVHAGGRPLFIIVLGARLFGARHIFAAVLVCSLFGACGSAIVRAQPPAVPSPGNDYNGTPSFRTRVGDGLSYRNGYGRLDYLFPLRYEDESYLTFCDMRFLTLFDGHLAGNVGFGHRFYSPGLNRTFAAYLYGDARNTEFKTFTQVSGGFETLGPRWDWRANWYAPFGRVTGAAQSVTPTGNLFLSGFNIFQPGTRTTDQALSGFDTTLSVVVPGVEDLRVFGGLYYFDGAGKQERGRRPGRSRLPGDELFEPRHVRAERPSFWHELPVHRDLQLLRRTPQRAPHFGQRGDAADRSGRADRLDRRSIRQSGGCDEALSMAIGLGAAISFASMIMASKVGHTTALHLHVTELLLMLGAAILMAVEPPLLRETPQASAPREHAQSREIYSFSKPSS